MTAGEMAEKSRRIRSRLERDYVWFIAPARPAALANLLCEVESNTDVVLDVSDFDATHPDLDQLVAIVLAVSDRLAEAGGTLMMCNPNPSVRSVLNQAGLHRLIRRRF